MTILLKLKTKKRQNSDLGNPNMKKIEAKEVIAEALVLALNEDLAEENSMADEEYHRGFKAGVRARVYGGRAEINDEDLANYPRSFRKGYIRALKGDWWTRFNAWVTDKLGQMGYSRTRGL